MRQIWTPYDEPDKYKVVESMQGGVHYPAIDGGRNKWVLLTIVITRWAGP